MLAFLSLAGLGALFTEQALVVSGYNCTSGCSIPDSYVNDNDCDCDDCDDETYWTCYTCSSESCPVNCTSSTICDGSGDNSTDYFYCYNGCQLPSSYYNDSYCDCSECEDEPDWTCSSCSGGCPNATECGVSEFCSSTTTSSPYSTTSRYTTYTTSNPYTTTQENFTCHDGCVIEWSYRNDGWCDCSYCEDETYWTCNTCSNSTSCPSNCTGSVLCDGSGGNSTKFYCNNGCDIPSMYYNDNWCDCSECEDEPYWNCSTCDGGCPGFNDCGGSEYCPDETTTMMPDTTRTTSPPYPTTSTRYTTTMGAYTTTQEYFMCYDGCNISWSFRNDGFCDCSDCEDETYWTCYTCSTESCPSNCTGYTGCDGSGDNSTYYFYCYSGCPIYSSSYNDSMCDCPYCEDEPDWTCATCGGCPGFYDCGDYVECNPNITTTPYVIYTTGDDDDDTSTSTSGTDDGDDDDDDTSTSTTSASGGDDDDDDDDNDDGAILINGFNTLTAVAICASIKLFIEE